MHLLYLFTFAFAGAISASFIGVIAERIHTGQSWRTGRSKCNSCRESLAFLDLVPVFSWLGTRGRCRMCGSKIPMQYALSEAVLAGVFVLSYLHFGLGSDIVLFLIAIAVLAFIVLYDIRHTIVPPLASNAFTLVSLLFAYIQAGNVRLFGLYLLTAGLISLAFFSLHYFSRGRAMGLGDAPIAFALSLLVGAQAVSGLLFSFWIGALFGIFVLLLRRGGPTMGIEIPFVPFLAIGYLLAYFTQWNPLFL